MCVACVAQLVQNEVSQKATGINRRAFLRGGAGLGVGVVAASLSLTSGLSVVTAQSDTGTVEKNLALFDKLDFEAYSKQDWKLFAEIHAPDVVVINTDGHGTIGIERHTAEVGWFFTWAPDHKIIQHPIRFGAGDWTAVSSLATGTFTKPMQLVDGSLVPPTGLPFKFTFATFAHWKNGRITEESLFGDLNTVMGQIMPGPAIGSATPEATPKK